jgi:hypothetical protein
VGVLVTFIALVASIFRVFAPYIINSRRTKAISNERPPSPPEPRCELAQSEMARAGSSGKGGARSLHIVGLHLFTADIIALLSQIIAIMIRNPRFLVIVVLLMLPYDALCMELGHADETSRIARSDLCVVATTAAVAAVAVAAAAASATLGVLGGRSKKEKRDATKKHAEQRRILNREREVVEAQATAQIRVRRLFFITAVCCIISCKWQIEAEQRRISTDAAEEGGVLILNDRIKVWRLFFIRYECIYLYWLPV